MAAPTSDTFCLPDLGEGLSEAEVVTWYVQAGDHVVADQPLLAVETDKAMVDIPAPRAGRLGQILAAEGAVVQVGAPLFQYADAAAPSSEAVSVVGNLDTTSAPEPPATPVSATTAVSTPAPAAPAAEVAAATPTVKASPRARQRARELGVVLAETTPSGPGGVVQLVDVEAAAGSTMSATRRAMARRMSEADAQVVRATVTGEADISSWQAGSTTLLRLIRAIGRASLAQPLLNAWFDGNALRLTPQPEVNLGIAMESAAGLLVPVLRKVNAQTPETLAAAVAALKAAVAERSIAASDLRGQTITLSNFGAVGGLHAEMVVVPPQVAIVGSGRAFPRVVLTNGQPAERRVLPLSITFDHRAVTGAEACVFLVALIEDLERVE